MKNSSMQSKVDSSRIENTLSSLDKVQRATPQPFFYTRLTARMNNSQQNIWELFSAYITRPSIAFSGIFLIVIINIMAAWLNLKTPVIAEESEAAVTEEYTQLATNFYDFENIKP